MNTYPDCYPCLVRHSVEAVKLATDQIGQQRIVLKKILRMIADEPLDVTPVRLTAKIHRVIQSELGIEDPYRTLKVKSNTQALNLLPDLYRLLDNSADRLEAATRIAKETLSSNHHEIESINIRASDSLDPCHTSAYY
jgi:uncharacterized protein with ATP-grasp and redox domains